MDKDEISFKLFEMAAKELGNKFTIYTTLDIEKPVTIENFKKLKDFLYKVYEMKFDETPIP